MNAEKLNKIETTLRGLHKDAKKDYMRIGKGLVKSIFKPMQPKDFEQAYLPISKAQGEHLRNLILENKSKFIVEFGTSFGISTIYLAQAAKQIGGKVISTELLESKVITAKKNIEDAGLSDHVEIRTGDAMKTLGDLAEPIDFLFLDGWKNLYLPLFEMLEPNFHSGTLIYSDNMDMSDTEDLATYLFNNKDKYETQVLENGKAFLSKVI